MESLVATREEEDAKREIVWQKKLEKLQVTFDREVAKGIARVWEQEDEARRAIWEEEDSQRELIRRENEAILEDVSPLHFWASSLLIDPTQIRKLREQQLQLDAKLSKSRLTLRDVESEIRDANRQFINDQRSRHVVQYEEVKKRVAEEVAAIRKGDILKKEGILKDVSSSFRNHSQH